MLHLFITRHGHCVHNDPENERIWKFNNDDVLGLTMQGIDDTVVKGKHLATSVLNPAIPTVLVHSGAVRSFQTASLLSQVLHDSGFETSLNKEGPVKPKSWLADSIREFPCPDLRKAWNPAFSFKRFSDDHRYDCDGWCESFERRVDRNREVFQEGVELWGSTEAYIKDAVYPRSIKSYTTAKKAAGSPRVEHHVQVVIVSHHYATAALLASMALSSALYSHHLSEIKKEVFLGKMHRACISHHPVFNLTPLLNPDRTDAFGRPVQENPDWIETKALIQAAMV